MSAHVGPMGLAVASLRAVDIAVSRLRKKLEPTDFIKTGWGAGYSFVGPRQ
ncbi:MAG: hypothetical protein GY946_13775 [bacterium]|nr:hypothetical protein [bacterium]